MLLIWVGHVNEAIIYTIRTCMEGILCRTRDSLVRRRLSHNDDDE